jgi:hypothetical protein
MTSIFQRALGPEFDRLHPRLRQRFGFASTDGVACVGTGTMDEIWHGRAFTLPFLYLGAARNILFPERGTGIPFVIENYAYLDRFGRETVTFTRSFTLPTGRLRRFDATMIYSAARQGIVDYLGTHQHLAVDLSMRVDDAGGLWITSGSQRFCEGVPGLRVPASASGNAELHEWYDDEADRFRIAVTVTNPRFGPLFGYRGSFTAAFPACVPDAVPATVRPMRESVRE